MATPEIQRLFDEGGGKEAFGRMPLLRPFETPPPDPSRLSSSLALSPQERSELEEVARLLLESALRLTVRFGLTPWRVYEILMVRSLERNVSVLQLTRRVLTALA